MINKVDADRLPEHDITPKTVMMKTAEQLAEEAAAVAAAAAKKAAGSSMGGAKKKKNGNKKDAGIGVRISPLSAPLCSAVPNMFHCGNSCEQRSMKFEHIHSAPSIGRPR